MCHFIESIRFEDGQYHLLSTHQERMNKAFADHFPHLKAPHLRSTLPELDFSERHKVRVVYGADKTSWSFERYAIKPIQSLRVVHDDSIDYEHKYEDRSELEKLHDRRGDADDVLIIKNGLVTDTYYANTAFWDGEKWFVPSDFLLNGVKRQHLLESGLVKEQLIKEEDIAAFQKVSLINALLDLGECEISISQVKK